MLRSRRGPTVDWATPRSSVGGIERGLLSLAFWNSGRTRYTGRMYRLLAATIRQVLIYLHPYEFVTDRSFSVTWSELEGAQLPRRAYFWARQCQWHVVGNRGLLSKLARVLEEFEHAGPMKTLLHDANGTRAGPLSH